MQFIFAYNYLDNKDNRLQKTCAWVYLEWIERAFFRSPLDDIFVGIFWLFFSCLHALHAYVYILRSQEKKNLVLMRRLT